MRRAILIAIWTIAATANLFGLVLGAGPNVPDAVSGVLVVFSLCMIGMNIAFDLT